jgi:hypothetical protein
MASRFINLTPATSVSKAAYMVARARASVIAPMPGRSAAECSRTSQGRRSRLPKSWYDAGDQLLGHVDVERLGDQGLHVVRDADAGGSPNDLVQERAVGDGVIGHRGAWRPQRRGGSQRLGDRFPAVLVQALQTVPSW